MHNHFSVSLVVSILSFILIMFSQFPSMAISEWDEDFDVHKTPQYRIAHIEFAVIGQTFILDEMIIRISRLEKKQFGKQQEGVFIKRLDCLEASCRGSPNKSKQIPLIQYTSDLSDPVEEEKIQEMLVQAVSAYDQNDLPKAKQLFAEVLIVDPFNSDAECSIGTIAVQEGKLEKAKLYYQAAHQDNSSDDMVSQALVQLEQRLGAAPTKDSLKPKIDLPRLKADAKLAFAEGNYGVAVLALEKVVNETPDDDLAQFALGEALRGKGDLEGAIYHIKKALALKPCDNRYKSELKKIQHEQDFLTSGRKPSCSLPEH